MYSKLESLRGVAAILVLLYHSHFTFGAASIPFVANSYLCVDFFFILSGFVLSLAYGDKIRSGMPFREYISLRLGRIYPLHLFMLLVLIPYILFKQYMFKAGFGGQDQFEDNNVISFLANLFMVHSMGVLDHLSWNIPSWSISVEFFAYIAFFVFISTLDRRAGIVFPFVVIIPGYLFLLSINEYNKLDITYDYGFIRCIAAFYCGVLLFRLKDPLQSFLSRFNIYALEILSVTLTVVAFIYAREGDLALVATLLSFCFLLMVFASHESGYIGRFLDFTALRNIGIWSYSIYMTHDVILSFFTNIYEVLAKGDPKDIGIWAIGANIGLILITLLVSRFTYIYVEKYFRDKVKPLVHGKTSEQKSVPLVTSGSELPAEK